MKEKRLHGQNLLAKLQRERVAVAVPTASASRVGESHTKTSLMLQVQRFPRLTMLHRHPLHSMRRLSNGLRPPPLLILEATKVLGRWEKKK